MVVPAVGAWKQNSQCRGREAGSLNVPGSFEVGELKSHFSMVDSCQCMAKSSTIL